MRSVPCRVVVAVIAVFVVAALTTAGYVALFTTVWSARTVHVVGVHRLSDAAVVKVARVDGRRPLLRLSTAAIATRVEALDDVASATVSTSLPGTVTIRVLERVPAAYVEDGLHTWQYVDASGRRFARLHTAPKHLPQLVPALAKAGDPVTLSALATVAAAVPDALKSQIELVSGTAADDVTVILRDKRVIEWGSPDRNADKASVLAALLRRPGAHFDVSNPDLVVAR